MNKMKNIILNKKIIGIVFFTFGLPVLLWAATYTMQEASYLLQVGMDLQNINDTRTNRIVYHSYNSIDPDFGRIEGNRPEKDDAYSELLIITPRTVYLLKDGYDDPRTAGERVDRQKAKLKEWNVKRQAMRDLIALEIQKKFYEKRVGSYGPDSYLIGNFIDYILRRDDPTYRLLYKASLELKSKVIEYEKNFGAGSPEARQARKRLEANKSKMKAWVEELRTELTQNAILNYSGDLAERPPLPSKDNNQVTSKEDEDEEVASPNPSNKPIPPSAPSEGKGLFKRVVAPIPLKFGSYFLNAPDGVPDYIAITSPGADFPEYQAVASKKENTVKDNFNDLFKNVRKRILQRYVNQFFEYMYNSTHYGAIVKRRWVKDEPLCRFQNLDDAIKANEVEVNDSIHSEDDVPPAPVKDAKKISSKEEEDDVETKSLYNRVDILSPDHTMYSAIDCDGEGATRTFIVYEYKGLSWTGIYKDVPNVISIFNNRDPEIQAVIGKMVLSASQGDPSIVAEFKRKENEIQQSIKASIDKAEEVTRFRLKDQPRY